MKSPIRFSTFLFPALTLSLFQGAPLSWAAPSPKKVEIDLPADARALLKTLPNERLELDFVVGKAALVSDSFKIVQSQRLTQDVAELQATAALDWKPYIKVGTTNDQREPANPFSPNRIIGTQYSVGAQTLFSSGTSLVVDITQGTNELGFANPAFGTIEYAETKASLTLSQSLWQNAFGSALRSQVHAAENASKAAGIAVDESTEEWALGLINLYYNAWLAKAQAQTADASLERRRRLLSMIEILTRRGTSEKPDLLQVQSAVEATEVQAARVSQALGDIWRNLVTALKLPQEWMKIDPKKIPIALDEPVNEALALCGTETAMKAAPEGNLSVRRAAHQQEAAQEADHAASSLLRPDLSFSAQLANNAIDNTPAQNESFSEFTEFAHPAWTVGLSLTMPIGFTAEKARKLTATADLIRAEAAAQQARDDHQTQWINRCLDLFRVQKAYSQLSAAFKNQSERSQLEEDRFRIGRVGTFQVIQAGDDATQAEFTLRSIEVERRMAAWKVRRQAGQTKPWLESIAERLKGSATQASLTP